MKILLILPANPSSAPYLQYYINIIKKCGYAYDVCYWDRNKEGDGKYDANYKSFKSCSEGHNFIEKIWDYINFGKFVRMQYANDDYNLVIIFTLQMLVFLSLFLYFNLKNKYIADIRDYCSIMKIPFIKYVLKKVLRASALNCISSNGFKKWLPTKVVYCLSHNMSSDKINVNIDFKEGIRKFPINVLTIGALRDLATNILLIKGLCNDNRFFLTFSGQGPATKPTQSFVQQQNVENIIMTGAYHKSDEDLIINKADMMNILLSDDLNSRTLMANRFYLSVLYRKPMIVSANTETAFYVDKYCLGVVVRPNDDIKEKILDFWENFDYQRYNSGCKAFIEQVKIDILSFEDNVSNILSKYVDIRKQNSSHYRRNRFLW